MADSKKVLLKGISEWKKRIASSRNTLRDAYKDVSKDVKKAYKQATK